MTSPKDIKQIPLFSGLSEEEIGEIASYVERKSFSRKKTIFFEGKVKITKLSHDGKEIIIELISPRDFFGGFAVLNGFPYPANAVAMEDSVIIRISRRNIMGIIERFPNFMYDITANLGERVREFHDTLKNIALERVESRIAALLLKLAEKTGEKNDQGEIEISMRLTKQDIAEMVGTTVETAIRVMSRFRKSGLIKDVKGNIIIKDLDLLDKIVHPQ